MLKFVILIIMKIIDKSIKNKELIKAIRIVENLGISEIKSIYINARKNINKIKTAKYKHISKALFYSNRYFQIKIIKDNAKLKIKEIEKTALENIKFIEAITLSLIKNILEIIEVNYG